MARQIIQSDAFRKIYSFAIKMELYNPDINKACQPAKVIRRMRYLGCCDLLHIKELLYSFETYVKRCEKIEGDSTFINLHSDEYNVYSLYYRHFIEMLDKYFVPENLKNENEKMFLKKMVFE